MVASNSKKHDRIQSSRVNHMACAGVVVLLAFAASGGCGGSSLPLAQVHGSVTYEGQPLDHGRVVFSPLDDTSGPQSVGDIQADGSFRMRTIDHDGAPLGRHRVTVHCRRLPTEEERNSLAVTELLIPPQYAQHDESPLVFEVTKGGNNEYNIVLQ